MSVSETSPSDRLLAKASLIGVLAEASGAELPCKRLQGLPLWQLLSLAKLIHPASGLQQPMKLHPYFWEVPAITSQAWGH